MPVIAIIACAALVLFCGAGLSKPAKTAVKSIPAAACAVYSLIGGGDALMTAGLFVCACADAVLEVRFIPGTVLFAAAHICFIAGFFAVSAPGVMQISVFAILALVLAAVVLRGKKDRRRPVMLAYCVFLALMVSAASGAGTAALLAGVLFALSDALIGIRILFGKRPSGADWICMGTYYAALCLIAFAAVN